jgi:hypothetical protein
MITKSQNMTKGIKYPVYLSKEELHALPVIQDDSYFKNILNWKSVVITYKADTQLEAILFPVTSEEELLSEFHVSPYAQINFQMVRLTIYDFDGGHFDISRDDIPSPEDFDIILEESSADYIEYISNYNEDAIPLATMVGGDPLAQVGQSFLMNSVENIKFIQVKAVRSVYEEAFLRAVIYDEQGTPVLSSSNTVEVNSIGITSMSDILFEFEGGIPSGMHFFMIELTNNSVLNGALSFGGKASNSTPQGRLYASGRWWENYDLDFKILTLPEG